MNSRVEPRAASRSSFPSLRDVLNGLALWCLLLLTGIELGMESEHAFQEAMRSPRAQAPSRDIESPIVGRRNTTGVR